MLIIDGVSIYELDEECLKKKKMPLDPDVYIHKTVDKAQEKEVEKEAIEKKEVMVKKL